ncbi:unnamed protein product, partial [Allacma fusca]
LGYFLSVSNNKASGQGGFFGLRPQECKENGRECVFNPECCSKFCVEFQCQECRNSGETCYFSNDCCSYVCILFRCW